jgi:hypothetical protein
MNGWWSWDSRFTPEGNIRLEAVDRWIEFARGMEAEVV